MTEDPPCPEWAVPGVVVLYAPHMVNGSRRYLGVITSRPTLCGGSWCVHLGRMEAEYRGGKGRVAAAYVGALSVVGTLPPEEIS